jgi:uncharacterized protein (DUF433 family)
MSAAEIQRIEVTPSTCGSKARVAGTRIRVQDIVVWTEQGQSPDEIVTAFPHLTLADVHAALAYYHDHRAQIDDDLRRAEELIDHMLANPQLCQPQRSE